MRTKIFLFQLLVTSLLGSAIAGIILISPAYAETKAAAKTTTKTSTKTATTAPVETTSQEPISANSSPLLNSTKGFFASLYAKMDAWRLSQLDIWKAIKAEKEEQIADTTAQGDKKRAERVDNVLDGKSTTVFQGSGSELSDNGNVFLLKLYSFALFIFVIIFSSPYIFYGIAIFLVLVIISRIINKIRHPDGY